MTPPYGRKWRGTKMPLDESEIGEWKIWLKTTFKKIKIMASGSITSWKWLGNHRNSDRLYLMSSEITSDGDCSHEIKRHLILRRKAMINLDNILKSRDITLLTKVHLVKAMVFPVVKYGCESWAIKKAECWRSDAFELWCWRRLLRVPWTANILNQSILKEISPEYSLKGLMLKLKFQYFGHPMWRTDSLEKTRMLGKIEGRRRGWQRMRHWMASPTRWTRVWASSRSWWWAGKPGVHAAVHGVAKSQTWLSDWTELKTMKKCWTSVVIREMQIKTQEDTT